MPAELNTDDSFIELVQEIEEEHLCNGLACPIALGRYLDGSPALFDLIQEGSLLALSSRYPYSESQMALDSLILTNLQLKTQAQFFLCDSPWRDWAELYDSVPAIQVYGFPEQADNQFCLLAAMRLNNEGWEDDAAIGFPAVYTIFESSYAIGGFQHLSHLAEDGIGRNLRLAISLDEKEFFAAKGFLSYFPFRILFAASDDSIKNEFIPGSSAYRTSGKDDLVVVQSSRGLEVVRCISTISSIRAITDKARGFSLPRD